jgi:hypothetical protein
MRYSHHLHDTCSVRAPPISGPATIPSNTVSKPPLVYFSIRLTHLRRSHQNTHIQRTLLLFHARRHDTQRTIHHSTHPESRYCPPNDEHSTALRNTTYQAAQLEYEHENNVNDFAGEDRVQFAG